MPYTKASAEAESTVGNIDETGKGMGGVGAQGTPPQNITQWHTDYFELKLLEKQPVQGHTDPPLYS